MTRVWVFVSLRCCVDYGGLIHRWKAVSETEIFNDFFRRFWDSAFSGKNPQSRRSSSYTLCVLELVLPRLPGLSCSIVGKCLGNGMSEDSQTFALDFQQKMRFGQQQNSSKQYICFSRGKTSRADFVCTCRETSSDPRGCIPAPEKAVSIGVVYYVLSWRVSLFYSVRHSVFEYNLKSGKLNFC